MSTAVPVTGASVHARPVPVCAREIRWSWQGQELALGVDEAGSGPNVLLLPALSSVSTRHEMRPLLQHLAGRFRVIVADWPGFGDRPRPAVAWTPDALSAFLGHFVRVEAPPLHATVAAGHAASYVLHFAAHQRGHLGKLAFLAPTWRGPLPTMAGGDRALFRAIRQAIGWPVLGPLLYRANVNRLVVSKMIGGHVFSQRESFSGELAREKWAVIRAPGARYGSAAFVTGQIDRISGRADFLDLARRAGGAALICYGAETPPRSRAEMEALAELPGMRRFVNPRGKLGFYEEFAEDVAPALLDFLQA